MLYVRYFPVAGYSLCSSTRPTPSPKCWERRVRDGICAGVGGQWDERLISWEGRELINLQSLMDTCLNHKRGGSLGRRG